MSFSPVIRSHAWPVRAVDAFRDDSLDTEFGARPGELARMLHVSPKTVTRWAREGKLDAAVTPGGHRRYALAVVLALLHDMGLDEQAALAAVRGVKS